MLIIFDLDGTLYNTSASVITAINRACVGLDIPPPPTANILNYIGLPGDVYFKKLFPNINEDKKLEISRISWAYELEEIKKSGNLYSGVKQMLSDLKIDQDSTDKLRKN